MHKPCISFVEYCPLPHVSQLINSSVLFAIPEPNLPPGQVIGVEVPEGQYVPFAHL